MLNENDLERYASQLIMPEIEEEGQSILLKSKILIIGAGGLDDSNLELLDRRTLAPTREAGAGGSDCRTSHSHLNVCSSAPVVSSLAAPVVRRRLGFVSFS